MELMCVKIVLINFIYKKQDYMWIFPLILHFQTTFAFVVRKKVYIFLKERHSSLSYLTKQFITA